MRGSRTFASRARAAALLLPLMLGACSRAQDAPPPILFISVDTLAAKRMSLYGYGRETTPALERFAAEAVTFEHCSANAPWTVPSYMSQFTGLFTESFLLKERVPGAPAGGRWRMTAAPTMAELLERAGYRTAAFVDNPHLIPELGFARGFETYDTSAADLSISDPEGGIEHLIPLSLDWIEAAERDGEATPWFALVQPMDPHGPYLVPEAWRPRFGDASTDNRAPVATSNEMIFGAIPLAIADAATEERPLPAELAVDPIIAAYDEGVAALDDALGRLFDGLRASGVLDRAVVIVSADHGESLGEHDAYFSHQLLYDEVLHVPLLIRLPGGAHGGTRVETPVQLVDLLPTVLELAGVDAPPTLHGRSLTEALETGRCEERPRVAATHLWRMRSVAFEGRKLIESRPDPAWDPPLSVLSFGPAREHLRRQFPDLPSVHFGTVDGPRLEGAALAAIVEDVGREFGGAQRELYRIDADPEESRERAAEDPRAVRVLESRLEATRALAEEAARNAGDAAPVTYSEERLQELKKLGYGG